MPPLPDTAVCLQCGYSLRGLPENVCPECGQSFDPANLRTWRDSRELNLLGKIAHHHFAWWSVLSPRTPRWKTLGLTLTVVIALAIRIALPWRLPENSYNCLLTIAFFLTARLLVWLVVTAIRLIHLLHGCPSSNCPVRHQRSMASAGLRWAVLLLTSLLALLAVSKPDLVNQTRLRLSRKDFEIKAFSPGPPVEGRQWVGLVEVDLIRRPPGSNEVIFDLDWDGRDGLYSFDYSKPDAFQPNSTIPGLPGSVLGTGWVLRTQCGR